MGLLRWGFRGGFMGLIGGVVGVCGGEEAAGWAVEVGAGGG